MSLRRTAALPAPQAAPQPTPSRVGHFVLPPLQNLRSTPASTQGFDESSSFFAAVKLYYANSQEVSKKQTQVHKMLKKMAQSDATIKPTEDDAVLTIAVSGLTDPEDRFIVAESIGNAMEETMKTIYSACKPNTPWDRLLSRMYTVQTQGGCDLEASSTVVFWHTVGASSLREFKKMAKTAARGMESAQGVPGLVYEAFGIPGKGGTSIAYGSRLPEAYVIKTDDRSSMAPQRPERKGDVINQAYYFVFNRRSSFGAPALKLGKRGRGIRPFCNVAGGGGGGGDSDDGGDGGGGGGGGGGKKRERISRQSSSERPGQVQKGGAGPSDEMEVDDDM